MLMQRECLSEDRSLSLPWQGSWPSTKCLTVSLQRKLPWFMPCHTC